MTEAPAFLHNARLDNLATNHLGRALYSDLFATAPDPLAANNARYVFLQEGSRSFYVDWKRAANDVVGILRSEAGRNPYDRDLSDLVGELSTRSHEFRTRWAAHHVRLHQTGVKRLHHPVVGELTLTYDRMELPADTGLAITTWTAEAGSRSEEALRLLASWAATEMPAPHHDRPSGGGASNSRSTSSTSSR
jgi:hypothetical protein